MTADPLYERLSAPFDVTFRDLRGGVEIEYVTGEQVVGHLNETLGVGNWSFRVLEHGIHAEADECWVLGELTATIAAPTVDSHSHVLSPVYASRVERTAARQQFGSNKIKRSRATGAPIDVGFDLKGAATDALKKCASLLGVALYLWKKEPPPGDDGASIACRDCGAALTETRFKGGDVWSPAQLAARGRRRHGRALCMPHYREANDAAREAGHPVGGR